QVITHGFFTVNGDKIGKSNNNAINPLEIAQKYGNDAVRYALLSEFQLGNDGDFSFERLETKYNSDLANNWGNLLNRVIHLSTEKELLDPESGFMTELESKVEQYHKLMGEVRLFEAIQLTNDLAAWGNQYISERKPWEDKDAAPQV